MGAVRKRGRASALQSNGSGIEMHPALPTLHCCRLTSAPGVDIIPLMFREDLKGIMRGALALIGAVS